jgi:hypothetical protein
MNIMRGLVEEELENSIRIKASYEKAIQELPRGSLSKKKIHGREYYYLFYRESPRKVRSQYLGKLSEEQVKEYEEKIERRRRYEELVRESKRQISFFKKVKNVKPG